MAVRGSEGAPQGRSALGQHWPSSSHRFCRHVEGCSSACLPTCTALPTAASPCLVSAAWAPSPRPSWPSWFRMCRQPLSWCQRASEPVTLPTHHQLPLCIASLSRGSRCAHCCGCTPNFPHSLPETLTLPLFRIFAAAAAVVSFFPAVFRFILIEHMSEARVKPPPE